MCDFVDVMNKCSYHLRNQSTNYMLLDSLVSAS